MPGREAVSTLHRPKNGIMEFFKFLQKKVSRLDKRNLLHSLNEYEWTWFLQITTPFCNYTKIYRKFFVRAGNYFLQKFEKFHFVIALLFQKLSRATFYIFSSTQLVDIFLSYLPVKQIWRKNPVWYYTMIVS